MTSNIPLMRSRRGPRRKLPSSSFISSSSVQKRVLLSPYTIVLGIILLLSVCYMFFVFSFLVHQNAQSTDTDIQGPHQLLSNNNKNNQKINNKIVLEPNLQFDSHNFLHEPRIANNQASENKNTTSSQSPPPPLIHIVHTRFMQHQGKLLHLAQARLHLFETFCLPTMVHQSQSNFLWFIQVDPEIDLSILNTLIQLVKPYSHFFVIATLVNYWIGPEKNGSWRGGIEGTEIWSRVYRDQVFSGNLDLILTAMQLEESAHPILLETRLDADDGLNTQFIETIQGDALKIFNPPNSTTSTTIDQKDEKKASIPQWLYWCSKQYLVWFYESKEEASDKNGFRRIEKDKDHRKDWGSVELRDMMEDECITPGLTVGMNRYTPYEDVPQYDHNQLYRRILGDGKGCGADTVQECIRFLGQDSSSAETLSQGDYLSAIRARTLTSAGMKDITPHQQHQEGAISQVDNHEIQGQDPSSLWSILQSPTFSISTTNVKETREYIQANIVEIAKENLQGQCRGKHSCKESSQILLQKIIDTGSTNVTV